MNINHGQNPPEKTLRKPARYAFTVILAILAVTTGIQFGNLLYKLDIHTISTIDPNNFKKIISLSVPIVETVYNSGKYSVSFSGEVKELFTKVFGFDLDSPASIFNVQSPLFRSYYRTKTMRELSINDISPSEPGTEGNDAGTDQTMGNRDNSSGDGADHTGTDGTGGGGVNQDPNGSDLHTGQLDGMPESSMSYGTEYESLHDNGSNNQANNGTGSQTPGNQQQAGSTGGMTPYIPVGQPISSVSYETEDDMEGNEKETVELDQIEIKNYTRHKIDIAKLLKEPLNINLSKKGPKVLIYHTHTTESYVLKEADLGKKDVPSFNSNPKYNVVRVGEELARHLEKYGIETLHNGTVHDKVHDAAYGASINTIQSYKKSYPSIQVYIDIHRDAVDSSKPKLRMTKEINGKNCAQIMFVVGADGMLPHPQWQVNLKFVLKLQQKLNEKYPGLAKPVRIVEKRYNQHISNNAILIEVGGDGNLLSECIESTKYLAEVLNDVMKGN